MALQSKSSLFDVHAFACTLKNHLTTVTFMPKTLLSIVAVLALSAGSAHAFNPADFPASASGGRTTFGPGTIGGGSLGPGALSVASDGTILAKGPVSFTSSGGLAVEAQLTSRIAKPALAIAIGRFLGRAVPIVATAGALYELAQELGFITKSSPSGVGVDFQKPSPGYVWSADGANFTPNQQGECAKLALSYNTSAYTYTGGSGPHLYDCAMVEKQVSTGNTTTFFPGIAYHAVPNAQPVDYTRQQFLDEVAARSGWPVSSALPRVVEQVIADGEALPATPEELLGPVALPPVKATTQTATGSTTITNITNNTYNGPTVTSVTTSTTQNYDTSGSPVGSPVVKILDPATAPAPGPAPAASAPQKIVVCGLPDTPACKIDETGTPKFDPKTMELDKATLDTASKSQRDTVASTTDKVSMFNPFSQFFILPPLSSCTPIAMPMYAGQQIASMDVCPAAEWLRGLMGFVWAAAGFAFVFRTVQDVI